MNELQIALKIALANTYVMYFKASSYHWNVEGMHFSQYHEFFQCLYQELYSAVDPLAERIRTIDGYAPISLIDLLSANTVEEDNFKPSSIQSMLRTLLIANDETIASLNKAFQLAEQQDNQGLMNLLADRLDAHAKHGWMLKSSTKLVGV